MAGNTELNITFDVDITDYVGSGQTSLDEMDLVFDALLRTLEEVQLPARWFIRIDAQLTALFGEADYIFKRHAEKVHRLKSMGHRLGWHCHVYQRSDSTGEWIQNTCVGDVLQEIRSLAPLAEHYSLQDFRMGWGFHTNKTMALLDELGFRTDSTAIPRPNYPWATSQSDWTTTPHHPYHPSRQDYRVPSDNPDENLSIMVVPMTTAPVEAPYDTQPVIRYLNPAYHHNIFKQTLDLLDRSRYEMITTITHPYELISSEKDHGLLSFSLVDFRRNLLLLQDFVNR